MARRKMLGSVDLLGLDQFGQNPGMGMLIGGGIGAGVTGVTTVVAGKTMNVKAPELVGLFAGLATSGVMYAMKSTRRAAIGGAIGSVVTAIGMYFLKGSLGLGIPNIRELDGLGIPSIRELNGLGIPNISQHGTPAGTIPGVAGNQFSTPGLSAPPVSLLGPMSPQAAHLKGIGGPSVHGLSASYGATLLGGGRQ